MPGGRDFWRSLGEEANFSRKIVDALSRIGQFSPVMALNFPYLSPNPLRPRAFGGKGAEGMKKEIPAVVAVSGGRPCRGVRYRTTIRCRPVGWATETAGGRRAGRVRSWSRVPGLNFSKPGVGKGE